jgi:SAM-dependent methyltransferase
MNYDFPDIQRRHAHGIGVLRETMSCNSCLATMRERQMAVGLLAELSARIGETYDNLIDYRNSKRAGVRILDTDSFSSISRILRGAGGYTHTQYRPKLTNGARLDDGSINVNLLEIPYGPDCFDVILTSDVMEHVAEDERAHREIYRCLSNDGTYIFTVPFDPCLYATKQLTQSSGAPGEYFILNEQIHGDPHSGSGIIAHRIYGQQFVSDLNSLGYEVEYRNITRPELGIFGGDLFVARKSPRFDGMAGSN